MLMPIQILLLSLCCAVLWCGVAWHIFWTSKRGVTWRAVLCCAMVCCAVLCCDVRWHSMAWRGVTSSGVLWHAVTWRDVLCCAVLCCALLCSAVLNATKSCWCLLWYRCYHCALDATKSCWCPMRYRWYHCAVLWCDVVWHTTVCCSNLLWRQYLCRVGTDILSTMMYLTCDLQSGWKVWGSM